MEIDIKKNGQLLERLSLENGAYCIGRADSCDIILNDNSVSKKHANLSIRTDKSGDSIVAIKDCESVNGLFFQGEKIDSKQFVNHFQIDIGPYCLSDCRKTRKMSIGKGLPWAEAITLVWKPFLLLALILLVFCSVIPVYLFLSKQMDSFIQDETLKRGIIVSRYLAEMNRPFLVNNQPDQLRVNPVDHEDGVTYAVIVDNAGIIKAPIEKMGTFLNWEDYFTAMEKGTIEIVKGGETETMFFYPIKNGHETIGAAIIGYDTQKDLSIKRKSIISFLIPLVTLLVLSAILLWHVLLSIIFLPIKKIEEEVGLALKEGRERITINTKEPNIVRLVALLNRLLLKQPSFNGSLTSSISETLQKKDHELDMFDSVDTINLPCILVEKRNSTVSKFNNLIGQTSWGGDLKDGKQVAEVFQHPELINAVYDRIGSTDPLTSVLVRPQSSPEIRIHKEKEDANFCLIVFEELLNGN